MKPTLSTILLAAILLTACGRATTTAPPPSTQPPPTTTAPSPTQPPPTKASVAPGVKALGFNYKTKDAGEGWNEAIMRIAFENISDEYMSGEKVDVSGATVETQEGKTYPVTVHRISPNCYDCEVNEIDFSELPKIVPPHFRWTRFGSSGEDVGYAPLDEEYPISMGDYYVRFRFASAAHPTRIVFPKRPDWSIDLATATQTTLAFPAEASFLSAKPMSVLAGRVLADDPAGLRVTLDGTGIIPSSSQRLELQYTIVNRDKLDSHKANITFPILAFFFGDGAVSPSTAGLGTETVEAGPDQTKQGTMFLGYVFMDFECNPNVYALVQEDNQYVLYHFNVCN